MDQRISYCYQSIVESGVEDTASSYLTYSNESPIFHGATAKFPIAAGPTLQKSGPTLTKSLNHLLEVAYNWHNIGVFLGVPNYELKCIENDYKKSKDCLREMLTEWLKQPNPTWKQLAEAVEKFDPTVAEKILAEQQ